jgi:hypothetical protein
MINVIADAILLYGYGADKHAIDTELAYEVIEELGLDGGQTPESETPPKPPALSEPPAFTPPPPPPPHQAHALSERAHSQARVDAAPQMRTTELPLNPPPRAAAPAIDVPIRRTAPTAPPPAHSYVLFGPEPAPKSAFAAWWARFRRTAFGIARPAPES